MIKDIKKLLSEGVKNEGFPGASFAVVFKNGLVLEDFVGYKALYPTKVRNRGNEIYDVASLTKVISTTTMIMKLIEEGKLSLNTKIKDILPEFKHSEVLIHHCLTHSSGLPADIPKAYMLRNRADVEKNVYGPELINKVGEKIVYSDIGFILLGFVIEKITQKHLNQYAYENIFKPLDMRNTSYRPDPSRCAPTEYREDDVFTGYLQGKVHDEKSFALDGLSGHAGLFSTVADISKLIISILNNDEKVLKRETVDSLFVLRKTMERDNLVPLVRTYGWDKPTIGGTAGDNVSFADTIVHTGFTGCNMWIDRSKGIGFVMLSNAVHPKRGHNGIIKYRNKIGNIIISKERGRA
jgi:CubicO group peptidase (beta-lactamase class C family)